MRVFSALRSSRGGDATAAALGFVAASCIIHSASAIQFNSIPSPNLDFSQLGRVALAGDFDSISLYQFQGQNQNAFSTNGSQSLLTTFPNGDFDTLAQADATIQTMCPFVAMDGTLNGVVVGGNFTSLGNTEAQGIALFNPNDSSIKPLSGLSGKVNSLYCDSQSATVYVGGSFTGGNSSNAIAWVAGWTNLPFAGFNGPVTSITKAPSGNIIFGGTFDGLGNTTTPNKPDMQIVNIGTGDVTATNAATITGFSDPRNIICKTGDSDGSGNTFLLADRTSGSWQAEFPFGFNPTKLRLYNTKVDGRGTKTWRYTDLSSGGIMNMTYTDAQGNQAFCDATCPLPANNQSAQDFHFVNVIGMDGFRIDISDWYGAGGGLSGIELFQNDIYAFAVPEFNEPTCDDVSTGANSSSTGPWTQAPSGTSTSGYLTALLQGTPINPESAAVTFFPDIKQSGNYSVTVYTPGCIGDNTCNTRGQVNLTGLMGQGQGTANAPSPISTTLFQTNNFDKYDQVYYGFIDADSGSFRPSITLTPSANQNGPLTVVAQRVRFELLNSTGGLNGLFEYNPNQATINTDFSNSVVDRAGMSLNDGAAVNSLAVIGSNVYVAGNFSSEDSKISNIFSIGENATALPGGGLDSGAMELLVDGTTLYVGGNFTKTADGKTQDLNGIAAFDTTSNTWRALGAGVHGNVYGIVPITLNITAGQPETVITVNGYFDRVNGFGSNQSFAAQNFAIWVPSRQNWLENLGISTLAISGQLVTQTNVPNNPPLLAGSVSSGSLGASDAVGLSSSSGLNVQQISTGGSGAGIQRAPPSFVNPSSNSTNSTNSTRSRTKRAVSNLQGADVNGAATGLFYTESNLNISIIGGHFTAKSSSGSTVSNLIFVNSSASDAITGLPSGLDSASTFVALGTTGTSLFAGGTVTGRIDNADVDGLVVYDLSTANYVNPQPPSLAGPNVAVNAIAPQPSSSSVYVGGSFTAAGSFTCPALCVFDTSRSQWTRPGQNLDGQVTGLVWADQNRLLVSGNLTIGGNRTELATFDPGAQTYSVFNGADSLPGPVTALTAADSSYNTLWVAGKNDTLRASSPSYISKYDGSNWQIISPSLGSSTIFDLQILTLTSDHAQNPLLGNNQILLVTGQLQLPGFGNASAALFDGSTFQPFVLSNTMDGGAGTLRAAFVENPGGLLKGGKHRLAVGFVVLIGLAIALALIFLMVVAGILVERYRRKRDGYIPLSQQSMLSRGNNMDRVPPEHLFGPLGQGEKLVDSPRI
ncbi:MAG: hypothetical protein M1820_008335 [Bogoriella megaspora]|nr:MAG: hypothetical protein M1820_008335 [Bogoriella megaspora]